MKNCIDGFYELIHKNSLKRRRMISLLLVLSIFVSSGVLWGLRDTGITMVNEALCGFEEHVHTDDCYEYVLVCGLEENEEHTHTAECYEKRLICGYEEHVHTVACYTGEDPAEKTAEEDEPCVVIDMSEENEVNEDEALLDTDIPELTLDNYAEVLGKALQAKAENPQAVAVFKEALEDDLSTPKALAALQTEIGGKNGDSAAGILTTVNLMDSVFSLDLVKNALLSLQESAGTDSSAADSGESAEIEALIAERNEAKKNKNWARADEIRNSLKEKGIILVDTPDGTTWKKA